MAIKTLFTVRGVKQLAILLVSSAILISCDSSPPADLMCVGSDAMGTSINKNKLVDSTNSSWVTSGNPWVDSGLDVEQGRKLTINTDGRVSLCNNNPQVLSTNVVIPHSSSPDWQDSGLNIVKGDKYTFDVTGQYTLWGSNITGCSGRYIDADCWLRNGKGLFAYIGDTPPQDSWFGTEQQDDQDSTTDTYSLFEMYRRDAQPNIIPGTTRTGYSTLNIPHSGKLWFRYRDSVDELPETSWVGKPYGWYTDNRGVYTVTVNRYWLCTGEKGKFLEASIAPPGSSSGATGQKIDLSSCSAPTSTSPSATGDFCGNGMYINSSVPVTGRVWLRIVDSSTPAANGTVSGDADYSAYVPPTYTIGASGIPVLATAASGSNSGAYTVALSVTQKPDSIYATLINGVIDPVRNVLLGDKNATPPKPGLSETMYKNIVANPAFINGVRAFMALSIVFYFLSFMIGTLKIDSKHMINYVLKMSIVITVISPGSWEFFSNYLFSLFLDGTDSLMYIMGNNINELVSDRNAALMDPNVTNTASGQGSSVFAFLNKTLTIIFAKETNIKLSALLGTFPIGIMIGAVTYIGIFYFLFAVVRALLAYLIAIIMIALLLFLAPIFISFILFDRTKDISNKWIKQMTSLALQPVMLFMVIAVFNVFILLSLYNVLNFSACYTCIWEIDLPISEIIHKVLPVIPDTDFDKFCAIHGYLPWGLDPSQSVAAKIAKTPSGLFYVLIFIILANLMLQFIDWVIDITISLTGAPSPASVTNAATGAMNEAGAMTKSAGIMGVQTARFAGRNTASFVDRATGYAISDAAKKTARAVLPNFMTKGSKNAMGERDPVNTALMTHDERKGYERKLKEFNNLSKEDQQAYRNRARDMRDDEIRDLRKGGMMVRFGIGTNALRAREAIKASKLEQLKKFGASDKLSKKAGKAAIKDVMNSQDLQNYGKTTTNDSRSGIRRDLRADMDADNKRRAALRQKLRGTQTAFNVNTDEQRKEKESKVMDATLGEDIGALGRSFFNNKTVADNILDKRQKDKEEKDAAKELKDSGQPLTRMERVQQTLFGSKSVLDSRDKAKEDAEKDLAAKTRYRDGSDGQTLKIVGNEVVGAFKKSTPPNKPGPETTKR